MTIASSDGAHRAPHLALAITLCAGLLSAGCSTLPASGPTSAQIQGSAKRSDSLGYRIVDIDPPTTETLAAIPDQGDTLSKLGEIGGRVDTLGPGDILKINVYEVGVTLFSGPAAQGAGAGSFNPAAQGTELNDVVVDAKGDIQLPYVGRLNVLGKTTAELKKMIENGMRGLSQNAQALVSVKTNAYNVFYVSGDVREPGRLELTLPQERLLDALARAGGTTNQPDDMVVRLTRGNVSAESRLSAVEASGPENVALLPGDRVELFNRPRTFLVFGSTDKVSQVNFGASQLSLAEALARIGGPADNTADPAAVYLFRYAERQMDGGAKEPVVYRLNMLRADSYFLSQRVEMRDKDVIYIASAAANAPGKLATIFGQLFSPFLAVRAATR